MNTHTKHIPRWSALDEQLFQELQQRRTDWNTVHRSNLRITFEKLFPGLLSEALIDAFISRAFEIRDALAPFDSGVRASDPDEG